MISNFCLILLLTISFGQNATRLPPDFPTLQSVSIEELRLKTEASQVWGMNKATRWDLRQDTGELVFLLPDGMKAVTPAQIIGTYNSKDQTWLWAWANSSIDDKLKVDALKVRKYGEEHHIERLTQAKWVGTEDDGWEMVALAVKLCEKQGAYLGPSGATDVFIAFGEVRLSRQ